ncbi:MAG: hypothetical protein MK212_00125 [Saprospiraceae bacterium]|nr:hypothetical protein [Saprospiraceae bacterium]
MLLYFLLSFLLLSSPVLGQYVIHPTPKEVDYRILRMAEYLSQESFQTQNDSLRGLLAKEAYELNQLANMPNYHSYTYNSLFYAYNQLIANTEDSPLFNVLDQKPRRVTRLGSIRSLAVHPTKPVIYTGSSDGFLLEWKLKIFPQKGDRFAYDNLPKRLYQTGLIRSIAIDPTGKYIAVGGDAPEIILYDLENKTIVKEFKSPMYGKHRIWKILFSPAGDQIIISGEDQLIQSINIKNKSSKTIFALNDSVPVINDLFLTRKGTFLVGSAGHQGFLIWNLQKEKLVGHYKIHPIDAPNKPTAKKITKVAIGGNSERFVALGYADGTVNLIDLAQSNLSTNELKVYQRTPHHGQITDIKFSPNNSQMIVTSLDRKASLWQISDPEHPNYFPALERNYEPTYLEHLDWVYSASFSQDSQKIITGDRKGQLYIWESSPDNYARALCNCLKKNLSTPIWAKYLDLENDNREQFIQNVHGKKQFPTKACLDASGQAYPVIDINP